MMKRVEDITLDYRETAEKHSEAQRKITWPASITIVRPILQKSVFNQPLVGRKQKTSCK